MPIYDNEDMECGDDCDGGGMPDVTRFAEPGGRSALRAASKSNPRNRSCPTCKRRNVLTPKDVEMGYQCNACADRDEMGGY